LFFFEYSMSFAFEGNLGLNRCNRGVTTAAGVTTDTPKWLQVRQGKVPLPKGTVTIPLRFSRGVVEEPVPAPKLPSPPPRPSPPVTRPPPPKPATPVSDLWTERFRGKRVSDIVGHESVISQLRTWVRKRLEANTRGETPLVAFLSGPPGTGKTTLSYAILAEAGLLVEEVNASEERTEAGIFDKLTKITLTKSMVSRNSVALILDEIDGGTEGTLKALEKFLKSYAETDTPVAPIICIANSLTNKNLREFARRKKYCLDLRVAILPANSMRLVAERALNAMGQSTTQQPLLGTLIQAANGDARKLLNFLQQGFSRMNQLNLAVGDPFCNLFKMTQIILSRKEPPRIQYALMEQESEMATLMLHHNYLSAVNNTTTTTEDLTTLSQVFSDADVLEHAWDAAFWSPEEYTNVMIAEAIHKTKSIGAGAASYIRTEFPMQYFQTRFVRPAEEDLFGDDGSTGATKKPTKTPKKPRKPIAPPTDAEKVATILKSYPLVPHPLRYAKVVAAETPELVDFRINY